MGSTDQYIHAKLEVGTDISHLITDYAAPTVSQRSSLWGNLRNLIQTVDDPLIIGGDFNTIIWFAKRIGSNGRLSPDSLAFGEWMNDLSLIDMGFRGNKFTWRRTRVESVYVAKKLDKVLCCAQTRLRWQEASVTLLPFLSSDHVPLYLQLCLDTLGNPRRRPFLK